MAAKEKLVRGRIKEKVEKAKSLDLENIIRECVATKASWGLKQNDLMFAVAFWSMVECGFQPLLPHENSRKKQSQLPKNWKHETRQVYEAHFVLPPHFNYPVKLVALPTDDILCINILASNVSSRNISLKSLAIDSTGYVPRPEEDTVHSKFSSLENIQILLRNAVIWPIRCSILTDQGIMNGSFCGLVDELKLKIIECLAVKEILALSQTCRDMNRICNDQSLWKTLFHKNFKHLCKCSEEPNKCDDISDWKENYKKTYFEKMEALAREESSSESYYTPPEVTYGSDIDFEID